MKKLSSIIYICLILSSYGQSKKELHASIERMKNDSISMTKIISQHESSITQHKSTIIKKDEIISKLNIEANSIKKKLDDLIILNQNLEEKINDFNIKLINTNDSLKYLNEILKSNSESINTKDLMKWRITYFEGVVDYYDSYDGLDALYVNLKNGNKITFYTSAGDGLEWVEIKDKNPPYTYNLNGCYFEGGCRIRGYYGKGYYGGYGSPSGSGGISPGIVNRIVYVENY
ncbi:MAG: hypothetical protein VX756_08840 [Bacteroidota bacterium]|nr:hypothetical protein [Bacteroidota bacterium]